MDLHLKATARFLDFRANMAHTRQSRPDPGRGFQVRVRSRSRALPPGPSPRLGVPAVLRRRGPVKKVQLKQILQSFI